MYAFAGRVEGQRSWAKTRKSMLKDVVKRSLLMNQKINSRAVERDIYDDYAGLEKLGLWVKANL